MLDLIFGGAALLIGGIAVACEVLESQNQQKTKYIRRKSQENRDLIRRRTEELQQYANTCDQSLRLANLRSSIKTTKKASDEAYKNYKTMKDTCLTYKSHINAAYSRIEELKSQIKTLKENNGSVDEIKRLSKEKNGLYDFIRVTKEQKAEAEKNLNELYEDLKQLNEMVKNLAGQIHESKQITYQSLRCKECGNTFELSNGEVESFKKKGLSLPKRCPYCRKNRVHY